MKTSVRDKDDHQAIAAPVTLGEREAHATLVYRPDIDALRAVAVLLVVLFHAYPSLLPSGFIGVDVFFVISGYLVTSIILAPLSRGSFSIVTFYVRRIRRIFPALIVVMAASLALGWFMLLPPALMELGKHVSAASVFLSNFLLGTETGYFDLPAHRKPMLHLWSLSIEEQFYLVWPILLFLFSRSRLHPFWLVAATALASFVYGLFLLHKGSVWAFYMPTARFWELMVGAAVATIGGKSPGPKHIAAASPDSPEKASASIVEHVLSVAGAGLLIAGALFVRNDVDFPGFKALPPTLGAACLVAAGPRAVINRYFLSFRLLVGIGLISYPLYLWHWPLLSIFEIAQFDDTSAGERGLIVVASFILAWLTYRLIERPFRRGGRGRSKALVLLLMLGLVGYVGHCAFKHEGFIRSRSSLVGSFYLFVLERGEAWRSELCFHEEYQPEQAPNFEKCTEPSPWPGAPRVYLWGDSHAASLYPGIKAAAKDSITLTQVTTALCPPMLDQLGVGKGCNERNQLTLDRIVREKPDVVILAGNWSGAVYPAVSLLVQKLKEGGVGTIIVVGRPPYWKAPAPHVVAASIESSPFGRLTSRFKSAVKEDELATKVDLRRVAQEQNIFFLSPYDLFCNEQGCLALTGSTPDTLITGDFSHMTRWGAMALVSRFPKFWCQGGSGTSRGNPEFCGDLPTGLAVGENGLSF